VKLRTFQPADRDEYVYELRISGGELMRARLTDFDRALLHDIEHGPASGAPVADRLLGLEMLARRIEEAA
jgi:hypothetical protein